MKYQTARFLSLCFLLSTCAAFAQNPEAIPQTGHANEITAAAYAMNGKIVISSSKDNIIKLWNAETVELLQTLADAALVTVGPDDRTLLTVEGQRLKLRNLQTGQVTALRTEPILGQDYSGEYPKQIVAFSPDGKRLLRVGTNPLLMKSKALGIQVWNLNDGSLRFMPLTGDFDYANSIFSSDGELLVAHNSNEFLPNGGVKKKRGMVRVLEAETGKELYTLTILPNEEVKGVSLSPDNKILVSESESSNSKYQTTLIFSEARTGKELHRVKRDGSSYDTTFSLGDSVFAVVNTRRADAGKSDSSITIADALTGKSLYELPGGEVSFGIQSIAFSPDGKVLAASFSSGDVSKREGRVRLWDAASGKQLRSFNSKQTEAHDLTFSPDNRLLASWGDSNSMELWDVVNGTGPKDFAGYRSEVQSIEISPDNKTLAIAWTSPSSSQLRLWSLTYGEPVGPAFAGEFVTFSRDGRALVVTQSLEDETRRQTRLLDSASGAEIHSFEGEFVSLSSDGKRIFTRKPVAGSGSASQPNGSIVVWDALAGREVRTLIKGLPDKPLDSLAVSPDGQSLALVRGGGSNIELMSVETGSVLKTIRLYAARSDEGQTISLTFSPDSKLLASSTGEMWGEHRIKMWRVATGALLYQAAGGMGAGVDVIFSPDGRIMATTGNAINSWDVSTGRRRHSFDIGKYVYETAEYGSDAFFSPDGKILAGYADGGRKVCVLWDAATGSAIPLFRTFADEASAVTFSPDTKYMASLGRDGVVRFWRVADRQLMAQLFLFADNAWLALKPDGHLDGSSDASGKLRWHRSQNLLDIVPGDTYYEQFHSTHLLANIFTAGKE